MPSLNRAFSRAVLPMLAAAASLPATAAANDAPPAPTSPITSSTGGTALSPLATPAAVTTAESPRIVHVLSRDLTTEGSTTVSVQVRALLSPVALELRVGSTGRKVADATLEPGARVTLHGTANRGEHLRLLVKRTDGGTETNDIAIGAVQRLSFRQTLASWYGPGLFGQKTACGRTLTSSLRGVANKSLPCGTKLTVRYRGRSTEAVVVDRGPFAGNREFDLTSATAKAIGFSGVGRVWVSY